MKPEIKIEPAKFKPHCFGCNGSDDVRSVMIGHTTSLGGSRNVSNICTECRALLLLELLAELPAVPCGYTLTAEKFGKPPGVVEAFVHSELGIMGLEEAAGLGAALIRKALEATKL